MNIFLDFFTFTGTYIIIDPITLIGLFAIIYAMSFFAKKILSSWNQKTFQPYEFNTNYTSEPLNEADKSLIDSVTKINQDDKVISDTEVATNKNDETKHIPVEHLHTGIWNLFKSKGK